jgi:uncharacterized protein YecE (DUF72 family)
MRRHLSTAFVGTAGWANPPAERECRASGHSHLEHYATQFNAVEINSSFYRSHQRMTYARWRQSTPKEFRFSVKAPRTITHDSTLRHCRAQLSQFLEEVSGLQGKLRVILVQTPASLEFAAAPVARFFASLTAATSARIACEARHPTWFSARAQTTLARFSVARVVADPARVADAAVPLENDRLVYYRLHGSPRMYYSAYSTEFIQTLSTEIRGMRAKSKEVWCIFDNTARHASWANAVDLRRLLAS